jgi:hypothetical protein
VYLIDLLVVFKAARDGFGLGIFLAFGYITCYFCSGWQSLQSSPFIRVYFVDKRIAQRVEFPLGILLAGS